VTPEGNLTSCYEILHPEDPLRDPFFYGSIPPDGSRITVDPARVNAIRNWAKRRREACAHCFCVYACAGDCAAKVMDDTLSDSGDSRRCRITRALVFDMIQALLAGEIPRKQTVMTNSEAPSAVSCNCVDCSRSDATGDASTNESSGRAL
jgi:radical SAM protein with 4Fe4S-binding SPASM domain